MKITKKEVEHVAQLARLRLDEKESEKYAQQLSSILEYVEQLQKIDTQKVSETAQVTGLENIMREDAIFDVGSPMKEKILEIAPESENNLIKTKNVFE